MVKAIALLIKFIMVNPKPRNIFSTVLKHIDNPKAMGSKFAIVQYINSEIIPHSDVGARPNANAKYAKGMNHSSPAI